ncbi:heat shock protein 90-6, mitochondrial [Panicum miliaceum]|uniref:Heat shock protein 90-6, mitochondrial n=1 Tax=Panicum miliaceum TaxID=4540 RepID=A0A3L6SLS8_PANMI|nr:heat shock protein 90-6, mitochondrial [Panicum miliaceum]
MKWLTISLDCPYPFVRPNRRIELFALDRSGNGAQGAPQQQKRLLSVLAAPKVSGTSNVASLKVMDGALVGRRYESSAAAVDSTDMPPAEKHEYQADVNRLMDLIVHSLYSNKEVFLRELVSNASDALDKLRYLSVTDPELLKDGPELDIRIQTDKDNGIRDNKGFAHPKRIQKLVKNYSQFVSFPIYTWQVKGFTKEVEVDEDPEETEKEGDAGTQTHLRNPKEVSTEEYNQVFKKTFNEYFDPLASSHFTTEVLDVLFETAMISSGFTPDNPAELNGKIYEMLSSAIAGKWSTQLQAQPASTSMTPQHNVPVVEPELVEAEAVELEPVETGQQK